MTKTAPEWMKRGFRPHGPYQCRCPRCGTIVSTNALAWRNHETRCVQQQEEKELR